MEALYPEFCQQMQMKIIGILLKDVYITPDTCLQKSRILVRKGRGLRVCGIEGLKDCIQCLSDSISTIVSFFFFSYSFIIDQTFSSKSFVPFGVGFLIDMKNLLKQNELYGETCSRGISTCHQLAVTYCLRALCIQEAEPNSKVLMLKRLVSRIE